MINVTKPFLPPLDEYIKEISDIWKNNWLTNNGPKLVQFESKLRDYLSNNNTSLFVNGHMALESLLKAFNFPKGSEIITSPFTFISTTNAILKCGYIPVFCDIEFDYYTIDTSKIEKLITKKTVAILPIHVFGNVCDVWKIEEIAKKYGLKVIYDSAHAFGEKINDINIANFGDANMFSFHATKVFNTIEGGCAVFKDPKFVDILNDLKNFGLSSKKPDEAYYVSGNAKMNEFQACMGICNLRYMKQNIEARKRVVARYIHNLSNKEGIKICLTQHNVQSNYSYFTVVFDPKLFDRNLVHDRLKDSGFYARKYFYPLTTGFKCIKKYDKSNTPVAKMVSDNILSLPLYPGLDAESVDKVCDVILSCINSGN